MILISYGTRPEYIKVKSLIMNLNNVKTLFTGQHTTLIGEHSRTYSIEITSMCENRLNDIICSILKHSYVFKDINYVLVQGDTTSALAVALSAFNHGVKVIHLEAGLRTHDINDPYPEEMNRQLISRIATINLCPTENNKQNLINEQSRGQIFVTGNTGLDNIDPSGCTYENIVIITMHRRDNIDLMHEWFTEINNIAGIYKDLKFVFPIHPSPAVRKHKHLLTNVDVIEPITHGEMIGLLKRCKFVISDSGSLGCEENAFLHKKAIVPRKKTERPETLGTTSFLCEKPSMLLPLVEKINNDYIVDSSIVCPYGSGNSWKTIKEIFTKLEIC